VDPKDAPKIAHIPIWVFHGDRDMAVKYSFSKNMVTALKKQGSKVKFTTYEGVGHNSWTRTYNNPKLYEWMLQQKLN
jgi:predicted peptidase